MHEDAIDGPLKTAARAPAVADEDDDRTLAELGYRGDLKRALHAFDAFAISFSNASVTTGVFIALGSTYALAGPAGIWMSLIDVVLMASVALVYAGLAARFPITGLEYQWASRLAGPLAGTGLGWLWFAVQTITVVAVDYTLASTVLPALFGYASGTDTTMAVTAVVIVLQALLLGASVRATARVNNAVVIAELVVVLGLTALLVVVGLVRGLVIPHNLIDTAGTGHGYLRVGGHAPGAFWLVISVSFFSIGNGFQGAGNGAEETHDPRRVIPRAMLRTLAVTGATQMLFLIALVLVSHRLHALGASPTAAADVIRSVLGGVVTKVFLVVIVFNVFACGLVIQYQQIRYAWAMSRDRRFLGSGILSPINRRSQTPVRATVLCALLGLAVLAAFGGNGDAFDDLIAASGLVTIIAYLGVMVMSLAVRTSGPNPLAGALDLGRWRRPVAVVAIVWLAFALSVFRSGFASAWEYAAAVFAGGAVFVGIGALTSRAATPAAQAAQDEQPVA